jgi:L-threonylcarbamoyladenylate synthase
MTRPLKDRLIKIAISDKKLLARQIDLVAKFLNDNKTVILPAKTMYGISARFDFPEAIKKIYEIKKRPEGLPFIVLVSDTKILESLAADISANAKKLVKVYWNKENVQPLTMIFKKNIHLADFTKNHRNTIAIRMAEFDFIREIIDKSAPIISTSANLSGTGKNPLEIGHIPDKILDNVDMVVEYKDKLLGVQSTIIDVSGRHDSVKLIRQGAVSFKEILQKI